MKQCFTNATVAWNELEIIRRESLIREIPILLNNVWRGLNPAVRFERVETPILTPASYLQSHINAKFELIEAGKRGFLRPETTAGTFEAMSMLFPQKESIKKHLPLCLWQVGLSFRDEKNPDTMRASKLRLVQFYQIEFQLFCSHGTKAPYLETAANALTDLYCGHLEKPEDLPHYSEKTIDWVIDTLEVGGLSKRTDWEHGEVYEVAIGIDRLVAKQLQTFYLIQDERRLT
jgi:glycyl-tRNA synthetase (class II)